MNKYERHLAILSLISESEIQTQDELAGKLMDIGIYATQATVSRDIRELKLVKVLSENGVYKYSSGSVNNVGDVEKRMITIFENSVLSVESAENMLVLKTLSGMAQAAAAALDAMDFDEILGCIAGDDTIIAVLSTKKNTDKISARLRSMIH